MKHLKKFEDVAHPPLPVIPTHLISIYSKCDECGQLSISDKVGKCKKCGKRMKEVSEKEYDIETRRKVPRQFWHLLKKEKDEFMDRFVPLSALKQNNTN